MNFDYNGYELVFIQKSPCKDSSPHLFTLKYKFFSPITKYWYVLHADYHEGEVFAIKFYCKKDKCNSDKYSKIVNRGDFGNIIMTCAKSVPILLQQYPNSSFAFGAARSIDKNNNTVEPYTETQRFRIYKEIVIKKFGEKTFTHYEYKTISCYMLINNQSKEIDKKEEELRKMFTQTYNNLLDV